MTPAGIGLEPGIRRPPALQPAASVRTTSTSQGAWRTTFEAVEPKSRCSSALWPICPRTISVSGSAAPMSSSGGTPVNNSNFTGMVQVDDGIGSFILDGVGSQIGALSFASRVAVQYKLDPDELFQLFQTQDPSRLLGICSPAASAAPDYVRAVLAHLEKNPGNLQRPIAEVFYESLQASFPCD